MKFISCASLLFGLTFNLYAAESRRYQKISSTTAEVIIETEEKDSAQATTYLDAQEHKVFINDLLKDSVSLLAEAANDILKSNCGESLEDCGGEVTLTDGVKTGFSRDGWMSGASIHTYFLGFTFEGSGQFFQTQYMFTVYETAEARLNENYDYSGIVAKKLILGPVTKIAE